MNIRHLAIDEQERIVYASGDTRTADLLDIVSQLESELDSLEVRVTELSGRSMEAWETENGNADQYRQFFYECFRKAGKFGKTDAIPDVSNYKDWDVIFDRISQVKPQVTSNRK